MKATLEFNLPKEREAFETAVNSYRWRSVVSDMDNYLRGKIKYAPDDMADEFLKALEMARTELHELITSENLAL